MASRRAQLCIASLAFFSACGDDSGGSGGGGGTAAVIPPGQVGGACLEANACSAEGAFCYGGICREPGCLLGEEGCSCLADQRCGRADDGSWLVCADGLCGPASCAQGEMGCGCLADGTCFDGLVCGTQSGVARCEQPDCALGEANCGCQLDRTCGLSTAGAPLVCDGQRCIEPDCPVGTDGCLCEADYSCEPGLLCAGDGRCGSSSCERGELGCSCFFDSSCGGDLYCAQDGTCQSRTCAQGAEGCGCFADATCETPAAGGLLVCRTGVCITAACTAGEAGCGCTAEGTCDAEGLVCAGGLCVGDTCMAGDPDCPCGAGGTCDTGFLCRDGLCVDGIGLIEGPCFPNGTCEAGARCQAGVCTGCSLGTASCTCFGNDTCMTGLACIAGSCIPEGSLVAVPPVDPVCYSPCTDDLERDDGTVVICSHEGLMEGCPEDTECVEGSCVPEGAGPRECTTDLDCPDFQRCIAGQCYSECARNDECAAGLACVRHVCRASCLADASPCPAGSTCVTDDGIAGHCLPTPSGSAGDPEPPLTGEFGIMPRLIELNNTRTRGVVTIINMADRGLDFTVRKFRHTELTDEGLRVENELPLFWVTMGVADPPVPDASGALPELWVEQEEALADVDTDPAQELTFFVEGNGGRRTVVFGDADNDDLPRWEGTVEVVAEGLGREEVALTYASVPEGPWVGSMYYFANFRDQNFDGPTGWLADRDSALRASRTENAFIRRWVDFRTQAISLDEWLTVAAATSSGSWAYPSVRAVCERPPDGDVPGAGLTNGACYLYDNAQGFSVYSDNTAALAVPSGVVELPISMNLRPVPGGSTAAYEGRINSDVALQYAGYPAVNLQFANNPLQCTRGGTSCLVDIVDMQAEVQVGARYHTVAGDAACAASDGFDVVDIPWLVTGFTDGTTQDPTTGQRYVHECRDALLPLGELSAELNQSLAGANPIPDGRPRVRHVELVDGMLINQDTLFILFREWYEEFLGADSGTDEPPFSAYGMMIMRRGTGTLQGSDYAGNAVDDDRDPVFEQGLSVECDPQLVTDVLAPIYGPDAELFDAESAAYLAWGLITGMPDVPAEAPLDWDPESATDEQVHYFCEDTGTFDYGPGGEADPLPCPPGSRVTWFTTVGLTQSEVDALACQDSVRVTHLTSGIDVDLGYVNRLTGAPCSDPGDPNCLPTQAIVNEVSQSPTIRVEERGTCQPLLNQWVAEGRYHIRLEPAWQCEDPDVPGQPLADAILCDTVRLDPTQAYDMRRGRLFYGEAVAEAVFPPVDAEIANAFRYKIRFRGRSGQSLGFVPQRCQPNSDLTPYCYDAAAVERIRDRVDCAVHVYTSYFEDLDEPTLSLLSTFLETSFSYVSAYDRCRQLGGTIEACSLVDPLQHYDGFERLDAELLIMLGDDALTRALGSRFDLAGNQIARFQGSLLEPGGIDLSGGAGFEMYLLYQATQYYEMVLDRFYRLSPVLWNVGQPETGFLTAATVTSYMERLVLASTRLTQASSEISRRYQAFNRPDLARNVIERAYTRAYLESVALTRMMQRIIRAIDIAEVEGVQQVINASQRRYRIAMLDMADAYQAISNDVNFFGFAPDYIPFPGLRPTDPNGVLLLLDRAQNAVRFAAEQEDSALESSRSFDVDAAQFQAELVRVQHEYEGQLGEVCGTFEGTDGRIYAATPRYVEHYQAARMHESLPPVLDDPCGIVGNGAIHQARGALESQSLGLDALLQSYENVLTEIELVRAETAARCDLAIEQVEWEAAAAGQILALHDGIRSAQATAADARRVEQQTLAGIRNDVAVASSCTPSLTVSAGYNIAGTPGSPPNSVFVSLSTAMNPGLCGAAVAARASTERLMTATTLASAALDQEINDREHQIQVIQGRMGLRRGLTQCAYSELEASGQIQRLWLRLNELEIQMMQQQYAIEIAQAELSGLRNRARRLIAQQEDGEQLLIDVEAVRNDPNVRIYRNAAILRADQSYRDALRAVYRATRVFEYYSSQSYARKDELFLIRMVAHGELNLEDYLVALENAFFDFEESFGIPDTRVEVLSLRDDLLAIPRFDEDLTPYSQRDRVEMLRAELTDVATLDRNGYVSIPFSTSVDDLSPVTRNHKLLYIEAELIGTDLGDTVARVYLRQRGTGTVRGVGGDKLFYAFPEAAAVLNPFLNGQRLFPPEIYRNDRLRDRPFANTHWELLINQRDETVNRDIDLSSITDIRLYLYYTDFTELVGE